MAGSGLKVVHYLNQLFGGIGGEDRASATPTVKVGPVGPGRALQGILKQRGEVVATVVCGDNYFAEKTDEATGRMIELLKPYQPNLFVAGPAFNAGRYGVACGHMCKSVQEALGIPAVTGMYEENPGVDLYRKDAYIIKTSENARGMAAAITQIVSLGLKLVDNEQIGKPEEEGYFARGIIKNVPVERNAAQRAVAMVLAKIKGETFSPELDLPKFDRVQPAPAIQDLTKSRIALVTDGGLVRKGNPDKIESHRSYRYVTHNLARMDALSPKEFEANHIGYDNTFVNENPNRLVPLDVLREMEKSGKLGKLHEECLSTAGVSTSLGNAKTIGINMGEQLKSKGVNGVILTST